MGWWSRLVERWMGSARRLLFCCVLLLQSSQQKKSEQLLPPGPSPWPIVGNLFQIPRLIHQGFARLSKEYGPLLFLRLGYMKVLVVGSVDMAKRVLQTQDVDFCSRAHSSGLMRLLTLDFQDFVMAAYSERWRHMKKIMVTELFSSKRLDTFKLRRAELLVSTLRLIKQESEQGNVIEIRQKLFQCFSNVLTTMIANKIYFGPQTDEIQESREFSGIVSLALKLAGSLNPGDALPFLKPFDILGMEKKTSDCSRRLLKFCQNIIDEHRQRQHENEESYVEDFVDILLACPGFDGGKRISDVAIAAVIQDMLVAGTDTSSSTTEWALAELMRNPKILRKAQEELTSVVGPNRLVTEEDIPNLKYVNGILKETFRLHPVLPTLVPRVSPNGGCKLAGYDIPDNTTVFVNVWGIGRDPAVWDRPDEFDPERFMGSNRIDVKGKNFELIPFGAGRRMCPGMNLGLLMSHLALAQLIHCFEWTIPDGQRGLLENMTESPGLTAAMGNPLLVLAQPRLSPSIL